ncbi:RB8NL protein, partial [Eudromia elegans]|nr:RB8NL protein [Eudromia elegans]
MSSESFAESLNKLKEIHEKEVQGLQTKLTELTTEKCRDAQRIEELFAKNHQLREQQKVLKENVKVLENRLRAGLCDRCMVTQELAKKKQNEYETSHFQSLQHIFILTNEMNRLKEENKTLKEDLKRLRSLEDRMKYPGVVSRESSSSPSSPLALLSPGSRTPGSDRASRGGAEEENRDVHPDVPGLEPGGDKSPGPRSSPGSRTSPSPVLQETGLAELASQRISNQLHGTIALVRPGSRPCLLERSPRSPPGAALSPAARRPPVPAEREHSPGLEAYPAASNPDSPKLGPSYEHLKLMARTEQLCLLNKRFPLHQLGLARSSAPSDGDSSFSGRFLGAKEAGGRSRRPRGGWEERAAVLELPSAVLYVRDAPLEGKLRLLEPRERLQRLLAQQRPRGRRAAEDGAERSPWPSGATGCKEESPFPGDGKDEEEPWPRREGPELRGKAAREEGPDVPLDLSDSGRGRDPAGTLRGRPSPAGSPSGRGPCVRHRAEWDELCLAYRRLQAARAQPGGVKEEEEEEEEAVLSFARVPLTRKSPSSDPEALAETGMRPSLNAQKEEAGCALAIKTSSFCTSLDDDDADSGKQDSEEPDTTDSEVTAPYDHNTPQEAQAEGKHSCAKDRAPVLLKKRKRAQDARTKASKKALRGRKKVQVEESSAEAPVPTRSLENCSASPRASPEQS